MAGAVFKETLRQHWQQILWWGLGLAVLGVYTLLIIPDVDMLEQYAGFLSTMPEAFMQLLGLSSAAALATPAGFIALIFGFLLLILVFWAVLSGLNVTANEEDEGIMDMLLSLPIPRWRIVLEKFLAFTLLGVVIILVGCLGFLGGLQFSTMEVDRGRLLEVAFGMLPSLLFVVALTVFFSTVMRRKGTAVSIITTLIGASYVLNFLAEAASDSIFYTLRFVSLFNYYKSESVMLDGTNWGHVAVLLVATVVLLAASLWAFERRDVGL